MANSYDNVMRLAQEGLDQIDLKMQKLHKDIITNAEALNKIFSDTGVKNLKQLNSLTEKYNKQTLKLEEAQKKLADNAIKHQTAKERLIGVELANQKKLIDIENKRIAQSKKIQTEKEKEVSKTNRQKNATEELNRAYIQLVNKQKQAKKILQDLIVTKGKDNKLTKQAQKEYNALTKRVNQANKATSNFSKTGLGSAVRGFKNLLGAFGVIGGIQMFANMTQEVFKTVKKLESLEFALKAVTNGTGELMRTQDFLSKISNKYGASIVGTTERYIKFLAAAKQSNVSMKETENIFGVVTKAAGVLGLKTDELSGIYLALEQMLSKGKVTTEELRRQLGERLPGAFGIMADALGVTTRELDKMLRKGEILSSEALPKFAEQLKNIPYLKNAKDIDTVVASQNRLNNSWIELIQNIEEGQGGLSSFFKTLLDGTTSFIDAFSKSEQASDSFVGFLSNLMRFSQGMGVVVEGEAFLAKAQKKRIALTNELSQLMRRDLKGKVIELEINRRINNLKNLTIKQLSDEIALLNEKEKLINDISLKDKTISLAELEKMTIEELRIAWEKLFGIKKDEIDTRRTLEVVMKEISDLQGQLSKSTKEEAKDILNKIAVLNQEKKAWELIKSVRDKVSALDIDSVGMDDGLSKYQKELLKVLDTAKKVEDIPELMPLSKETQERLRKYKEELANTLVKFSELEDAKAIFTTLTETFADAFDIDMSKFDFLFDGLENNLSDWANLSKELIGSVLDASLQRYDIELQTAQRNRDLIINNELATEEAKENARRKFEEERRRIQTERAKQERENALIKIAVDTGVAIVSALPNIPLSIAVAGIGLAQAAIVASQPLPEFEQGTNNAPEGWAITQEKRPEPIVDKNGNLKTMGSYGGDSLTYLNKGDRVFKNRDDFFKEFNMDNINKAVFEMNMQSVGNTLKEKSVDSSLLREMGGLRKDIDTMGRRIEKLASRPVNVKNKIELKDDRAY